MDPKACLRRWAEAESQRDAVEAARDYNAWVARGGFRAEFQTEYGDTARVVRLSANRAVYVFSAMSSGGCGRDAIRERLSAESSR